MVLVAFFSPTIFMQDASLTPTPGNDGQADLFQGLPANDIKDNLEGLAHSVDEEHYLLPLSEEELLVRKDHLVNNTVELNKIAIEKKAVTAELNGRAARLSKLNKGLLDDITHKAVDSKGKVYSIMSDDNRWVDKYNENGVWLDRRRAGREDTQRHINMRVS